MKLENRVWTLASGRKLYFDSLTPAKDGTLSGVRLDPPLTPEERREIGLEMISQWLNWSNRTERDLSPLLRWLAEGEEEAAES